MKLTVKRIIALSATILSALAISCVKITDRGDSFEAEFMLNTTSFFDGDEVSFTVRSNRPQVKVVDFSFPLAPDMVTVNQKYSLDEGAWIQKKVVSVPSTQRGKLSIRIQDPSTGDTREFSATYTAYQSSGIILTIDNKPVPSKKKIDTEYPLIVDGDDFQFTIRSQSENLILTEYHCEFNDGTLSEGKELNFSDKKRMSFTIPSVRVTGDEFTDPLEFSLSFNNPETGRDTTLIAKYYRAVAFTPTVRIEPYEMRSGSSATVIIGGNREQFTLKGFDPTQGNWFTLSNVTSNYDCKLGIDKLLRLTTPELTVPKDEEGQITFYFSDSQYTQREVAVSAPYKAAVQHAPSDVKLDKYSATVAEGETAVFNVSTDDTYSTEKFTAESLTNSSGLIRFYAPSSEEENPKDVKDENFKSSIEFSSGRLFVRGYEIGGEATMRVSSSGKPSVYKDVDIFVKHTVALVINGEFMNWIEKKPATNLSSDFSQTREREGAPGVGWYGLPSKDMTAELMTYSFSGGRNLSGLTDADARNNLTLQSVKAQSRVQNTISFNVSFGDDYAYSNGTYSKCVSSPVLYGRLRVENFNTKKNGIDPRMGLLLNHNEHQRTGFISDENRSDINLVGPFTQTTSVSFNGTKTALQSLTAIMKDYDCNARCEDKNQHWAQIDRLDAASIFSYASISVENVKYDTSVFDLRYVIFMYKVSGKHGSAERWWKDIDKSKNIVEIYKQ